MFCFFSLGSIIESQNGEIADTQSLVQTQNHVKEARKKISLILILIVQVESTWHITIVSKLVSEQIINSSKVSSLLGVLNSKLSLTY